MSTQTYKMLPFEHLQEAEKLAEYANTDRFEADTAWRQMHATLALAHATMAHAMMIGQMRA